GVTSSSPRLSSATTRVGGIPGELNKTFSFISHWNSSRWKYDKPELMFSQHIRTTTSYFQVNASAIFPDQLVKKMLRSSALNE
ncbi:MAG: hypothetical protein ACP5RH_13180, partial [Leptodesmis sp.]